MSPHPSVVETTNILATNRVEVNHIIHLHLLLKRLVLSNVDDCYIQFQFTLVTVTATMIFLPSCMIGGTYSRHCLLMCIRVEGKVHRDGTDCEELVKLAFLNISSTHIALLKKDGVGTMKFIKTTPKPIMILKMTPSKMVGPPPQVKNNQPKK